MSESHTPCPFCNRPVSGVHFDDCPRSRARMKARHFECMKRLTPRIVWAKGHLVIHNATTGDRRELLNPGVPYVRPGHAPYLGGKPHGKTEEVEAFHEDALRLLRPTQESNDDPEAT